MSDETDQDELATPEDLARLEGLLNGLDTAHTVALLLNDDGKVAGRIAELMKEARRLVTRLRKQYRVEPPTITVVLH